LVFTYERRQFERIGKSVNVFQTDAP